MKGIVSVEEFGDMPLFIFCWNISCSLWVHLRVTLFWGRRCL